MNSKKNLYLQFHVIFSLPLSNPNRGMNGGQKTAPYGSEERALISSQSLKYSIRNSSEFKEILGPKLHSVRTRHMEELVVKALLKKGVDEEKAKKIALRVNDLGMESKESKSKVDRIDSDQDTDNAHRTQAAFWISTEEIDALADGFLRAYEALIEGKGGIQKSKAKKGKGDEPVEWEKIPTKTIAGFLTPTKPKSLDIAGFGRFNNASNAFESLDSSVTTAWAFSTHAYMPFVDEWTAVDTLYPKDGAAGMGSTELGASVYYAYLNIDWNKLVENMDGNVDNALLFIRAIGAGLFNYRATGLVTSTAALARPRFFVAEVLDNKSPFTYAEAFERAVETQLSYDAVIKMINRMNRVDRKKFIPDPQNNRIYYEDCEDPLPQFNGSEANDCDEFMDRIEQVILSVIEKRQEGK